MFKMIFRDQLKGGEELKLQIRVKETRHDSNLKTDNILCYSSRSGAERLSKIPIHRKIQEAIDSSGYPRIKYGAGLSSPA